MGVVDTVREKDRSAANGDVDAILGRNGARHDLLDDNGSGTVANFPEANWVQTRVLHPLSHQVSIHSDIIWLPCREGARR